MVHMDSAWQYWVHLYVGRFWDTTWHKWLHDLWLGRLVVKNHACICLHSPKMYSRLQATTNDSELMWFDLVVMYALNLVMYVGKAGGGWGRETSCMYIVKVRLLLYMQGTCGQVVKTFDCGPKGPRFKSHLLLPQGNWKLFLSPHPLA